MWTLPFRTALAALSLCAGLAGQGDAQQMGRTSGNLLDDARRIITSDKGDVRLWAHPPRVVVITTDPFVRDELGRIRQAIEAVVPPITGDSFFGRWEFIKPHAGFAGGHAPLGMRLVKGGPAGSEIALNLGHGQLFRADIVIASADRATIAVLNGLWGLSAANTRRQMEGGRTHCFHSVYSREGVRRGAYVSMVTPRDQREISDCLWEDLLQTLGPLETLTDTPFFSFDHKILSTEVQRRNDLLLLRALYESDAGPGGSPSVVIRYLDKLRRADGEDAGENGDRRQP